jgi:hypothetical protein
MGSLGSSLDAWFVSCGVQAVSPTHYTFAVTREQYAEEEFSMIARSKGALDISAVIKR